MQEVILSSTLKEHEGFVYLEVPNEVIDGFFKLIPDRDIERPKEVTDPKEYIGAHVSVMYPEETKRLKRKVKEIGENYWYTLGRMFRTRPRNWDDVEEVYFIAVNSPQLEALRRKYGLRPKLKGHDFHITVACRRSKP